jgi:hypothetical protein
MSIPGKWIGEPFVPKRAHKTYSHLRHIPPEFALLCAITDSECQKAFMVERNPDYLSKLEAAFSIYAFGFFLDQVATVLEHGW